MRNSAPATVIGLLGLLSCALAVNVTFCDLIPTGSSFMLSVGDAGNSSSIGFKSCTTLQNITVGSDTPVVLYENSTAVFNGTMAVTAQDNENFVFAICDSPTIPANATLVAPRLSGALAGGSMRAMMSHFAVGVTEGVNAMLSMSGTNETQFNTDPISYGDTVGADLPTSAFAGANNTNATVNVRFIAASTTNSSTNSSSGNTTRSLSEYATRPLTFNSTALNGHTLVTALVGMMNDTSHPLSIFSISSLDIIAAGGTASGNGGGKKSSASAIQVSISLVTLIVFALM